MSEKAAYIIGSAISTAAFALAGAYLIVHDNATAGVWCIVLAAII